VKEYAIKKTLVPNAFVGANAKLVYEVAEALDISRAKVDELEATMNTIIDSLTNEFKREANTTEYLHKEELQRELQLQENRLTIEFEKKTSVN
jgi:hypothetical protein